MESRHPVGCDPQSFRRATADSTRIPRRPANDPNRPPSQHPSHPNGSLSYSAHPPVGMPRPPLGRSSRDRMASPSYASLVLYPGIDQAIRRLSVLAPLFSNPYPPSREFHETVYVLSTKFIEHVASERGALRRKQESRPPLLNRGEVSLGRDVSSRKRRRISLRDLSDSEDSEQRKKPRYSRPRRNSTPVNYAGQDEEDDFDHRLPEPRSSLPRKSKEKVSSLHEDVLALKNRVLPTRVIDVEVEHQSKNSASERKPIAVDVDADEEGAQSDGSEGDWVMPVLRPRPYVRDRPLVSDRTSLTPFIMDDDVDTDIEEQRVAAQKQLALFEAREKKTMELLRRARAIDPLMAMGASPPFRSSRPLGLRLCVDSVIIPIRGIGIAMGSNCGSGSSPCYKSICIPQTGQYVPRDPPRRYKPSLPAVLELWREHIWQWKGLPPGNSRQTAQRRSVVRKSSHSDAVEVQQETALVDQVRRNRRREQGAAVRILPRVEQPEDGTLAHASQLVQRTKVQASSGRSILFPDLVQLPQQPLSRPNLVEPRIATGQVSKVNPASVRGHLDVNGQNGVVESKANVRTAVLNGASASSGVYRNAASQSKRRAPVSRSNGIPQAGAMRNRSTSKPQGKEPQAILQRRPGSIDSSLGTIDIPLMGAETMGTQGQWSAPHSTDLSLRRSFPSPVTPERAQGLSPATFRGVLRNPMQRQVSAQPAGITSQGGMNAMQMNGIRAAMHGMAPQVGRNGLPLMGGVGGYQSQVIGAANGSRRIGSFPAALNAVPGGVGHGLVPTQMGSFPPPQQFVVSPNNMINLSGQQGAQHQLVNSAGVQDASHGVSSNIYQAVYEQAYRRMYAERQQQIAEEKKRAQRN